MRGLALVCCLTAAVAWLTPRSARGAIFDRIVAQVNDEIVTIYEVRQAAVPFLMRQGQSKSVLDDPERRRTVYNRVLDRLINRILIEAKARKNNLDVSDQQVDQALSMMRQRQQLNEEQFRNLIESYGISYDTYRASVRQNLLKRRLVKQKLGRKVSVSSEAVQQAYREQYGAPKDVRKQISLRQILVRPASDDEKDVETARKRARKILKKIESGGDFKQLAKKHSDGPSAGDRGYLGTFTRNELNPAFRETAFELGAGEHSDVVRTKFGFHILRVDSVTETVNDTIEKRKRQVRQKLRREQLQKQVEIYLQKLRREAFVDIKLEGGSFG